MSTVDYDIKQPTPLSVIMHKHDTDKLYPHYYDKEYERHFGSRRLEPLKLLEIGIGGWGQLNTGGAGLKTWSDYFPNSIVVGLDIEDKRFLMTDRIWVWKGSQRDSRTLYTLNEKMGPFDIVIDDGSHVQKDVLFSFEFLFPLLNPGGIYVIEDLATAYLDRFDEPGSPAKQCGGTPDPLGFGWMMRKSSPNAIRMICQLIDGLHHEFWRKREPSDIQKTVSSIHVSKELVFIYKQ